jgi:uncharacterized membrane protein
MKTVFAGFTDHASAQDSIAELESLGIPTKDISVILLEGSKVITHDTEGHSVAGDTVAGAAGGAVTGGVVGGLAGLLASAGVFPALAGFLIGGPIVAALGLTGAAALTASGAVTGAAAGGLIGGLTSLGVSATDAKYYDETVRKGGVLLSVPVSESNTTAVTTVLEAHGAGQVREVTKA